MLIPLLAVLVPVLACASVAAWMFCEIKAQKTDHALLCEYADGIRKAVADEITVYENMRAVTPFGDKYPPLTYPSGADLRALIVISDLIGGEFFDMIRSEGIIGGELFAEMQRCEEVLLDRKLAYSRRATRILYREKTFPHSFAVSFSGVPEPELIGF